MPFLNKRISKALIWVIAISLLNLGCIVFHPESAAKNEHGYYTKHYGSCGVIALHKARSNFSDYSGTRRISHDIQDSGNLARILLSLVHHHSFYITWPHEIKNHLNKHGYKVEEINDLKSLNGGDVAIVLVRGSVIEQQLHWMCYPNDDNIRTYFGENTEIVKIYLIKR